MAHRRYLLVSPAFPPPFVGGSKVWMYNLVENCPEAFDILTSPLKPGYDEVVSPRHGLFRSRWLWDSNGGEPTTLDRITTYGYMLLWCFFRLLRVRYDAVVTGTEDFGNGWMFLLGKLLRVPVIGFGNAEEFTLTLHGKGFRNGVKRAWLRFTHPKAAGFVAVCDFCKEVLVSIGADGNRIHVVPSSINPAKLCPRPTREGSRRRILSVGRLVERKGFHLLIDAVALLKDEMPDIRLTIVGAGPWRPILDEKVTRQGLAAWVSLKGGLADDELSALYSESDLFVLAHMMLPNGDTEGCPTVFSEAAGNGLPVIGGTGGGAATAIVHGTTGFIVDSRDVAELASRIRRILTDPALAESMGRAGIEKVRRDHDPARCGVKFYESLRRIVGPRDGDGTSQVAVELVGPKGDR